MSQAKSRGTRRVACASRGGFTLLEVLVATAVTLLMMVSLAQVFKVIGDSMKQGRAALELNSRLRNVAHRIQLDLNNITVTPRPGSDALTGSGYLKIYDGPLTDYSYGLELAAANRFGDVDDIIMFTARAGDDWFTGKVPLFVLQGALPTAANTELVTITAQHAEVVIFAEPLVTNVDNPNRDPYFLRMNPSANYSKLRDASGAETDLPVSYRLHYRTNLIRPDLNLATGVLPSGNVGGDWLIATANGATFNAVSGTLNANLPTPLCDMIVAHQQCDLSMRRVDPYSPTSSVAANSLEDLANPANRFAHVQLPLGGGNFTMPVLALSPKLSMTSSSATAAEPGDILTSASLPSDLENDFNYQSGFLHPAFTLTGDRTGEDVLASDVLAFDVKGYDPSVALYSLASGDVVSPSDPGYGTALTNAAIPVVGSGDFVDIGWGRKVQSHFAPPLIPARLVSQLSGIAETVPYAFPAWPFADSLHKSGLVMQTGPIPSAQVYSANLLILQPSYDTWYSRYEGDGFLQAELTNTRGIVRVGSPVAGILNQPWRATAIDAGTDGIDNAGSAPGVDDLSELETSAPFPMDLRGVKISIRMEDTAARQFNQMSVTKEFVTQ